jgi:hypothetical protein
MASLGRRWSSGKTINPAHFMTVHGSQQYCRIHIASPGSISVVYIFQGRRKYRREKAHRKSVRTSNSLGTK